MLVCYLLSQQTSSSLEKHGFYINTKHIRFKFVITIFLKGLVTIRLGEFHKILWFPPLPLLPPSLKADCNDITDMTLNTPPRSDEYLH
jgi:hypothetical protein